MIISTDLFTEARQMVSKKDIISHAAINSMSICHGDGSVKVKISRSMINTIRTKDWESSYDLNKISALLASP